MLWAHSLHKEVGSAGQPVCLGSLPSSKWTAIVHSCIARDARFGNLGTVAAGCSALLAREVFNSKAFHTRLGSDWGLILLGMYEKGIIWNNDMAKWRHQRSFFSHGNTGHASTVVRSPKQCASCLRKTHTERRCLCDNSHALPYSRDAKTTSLPPPCLCSPVYAPCNPSTPKWNSRHVCNAL
jgi:hypothetical protein